MTILLNIHNNKFIEHQTSVHSFLLEPLTTSVKVQELYADYERFAALCKQACKNYNKKYSCPPLSPNFNLLSVNYHYLVVNALKVYLDPYQRTYHSIRMVNNVIKSYQRRIFIQIEENLPQEDLIILENGSCRLCKQCAYEQNKPCKHPDKMHPSLEATGINVNELTIKCFGFSLQWYMNGSFPDFQCVVSAILTNNPDVVINSTVEIYQRQASDS
jgi:predicted metal-binding protein